ncbi:MAG: DciA family protein [Solirubrobacteraceae bacterium]
MSRTAPRPLSVALDSLTGTLAPASTLARVQEVWEQAAGPAIAASARPTAEHGGVLTVTCDAAVWAQELDLMADDLIARLNLALGVDGISALRCRTG